MAAQALAQETRQGFDQVSCGSTMGPALTALHPQVAAHWMAEAARNVQDPTTSAHNGQGLNPSELDALEVLRGALAEVPPSAAREAVEHAISTTQVTDLPSGHSHNCGKRALTMSGAGQVALESALEQVP